MPRPFLPGDLVEFLGTQDMTGEVVKTDGFFVIVRVSGESDLRWWNQRWWRHVRPLDDRALDLAGRLEDDPLYEF